MRSTVSCRVGSVNQAEMRAVGPIVAARMRHIRRAFGRRETLSISASAEEERAIAKTAPLGTRHARYRPPTPFWAPSNPSDHAAYEAPIGPSLCAALPYAAT